jgi:ferritin-like metal-binding protein YciE
MDQNNQANEKLIAYIQDAYAMENQIVQVLEQQVAQTEQVPDIQARIEQHLEETRLHRDRMAARLQAYNQDPSAIKGLGSALMGNMMGLMQGMRPDSLARTARDDYVTEHLEIAAYILLITSARAFGDEETARAGELNLRDEIAMQNWLAQNLPDVCLRALEQEGVAVPANAWAAARQPSGALATLGGDRPLWAGNPG